MIEKVRNQNVVMCHLHNPETKSFLYIKPSLDQKLLDL
jgi:hypothetical protein